MFGNDVRTSSGNLSFLLLFFPSPIWLINTFYSTAKALKQPCFLLLFYLLLLFFLILFWAIWSFSSLWESGLFLLLLFFSFCPWSIPLLSLLLLGSMSDSHCRRLADHEHLQSAHLQYISPSAVLWLSVYL